MRKVDITSETRQKLRRWKEKKKIRTKNKAKTKVAYAECKELD